VNQAFRSGFRRYLSSIAECDSYECGSGSSITPATFAYGAATSGAYVDFDPKNKFSFSAAWMDPGAMSYSDFNGDGLTDVCWWKQYSTDRRIRLSCTLGVKDGTPASGNYVGFSPNVVSRDFGISELGWVASAFASPKFEGMVDVTGDGIVDACFSAYEVIVGPTSDNYSAPTYRMLPIRCLAGHKDGSFVEVVNPLGPFESSWNALPGDQGSLQTSWLGKSDMNGDGVADPCAIRTNAVMCYISNPNGGARFQVVHNLSTTGGRFSGSNSLVDLNRDGLVDLCYLGSSIAAESVLCAKLIDSGEAAGSSRYSFGTPTEIVYGAVAGSTAVFARGFLNLEDSNAYRGSFVDINGDSHLDFCTHLIQASALRCFLGNGSTFAYGESPSRVADWSVPVHQSGRFFADVNGDGRTHFCGLQGGQGTDDQALTCWQFIPTTGSALGVDIAPVKMQLRMASNNPLFDPDPMGPPLGYTELVTDPGKQLVSLGGRGNQYYCRAIGDVGGQTKVVCTGTNRSLLAGTMTKASSLGRDVNFYYEYLPQHGRYVKGENAPYALANGTATPSTRSWGLSQPGVFSYPFVATTPQQYTVTSIEESFVGISGVRRTVYGFENFVVNVSNGRGALGFEVSTVYTPTGPTAAITTTTSSWGLQTSYSRTRSVVNLNWPYAGQTALQQTFLPNDLKVKEARTEFNGVYSDSTCGSISRNMSPWPQVVPPYRTVETTWAPIGDLSQAGFVSSTRTTVPSGGTDACGNVVRVDVETLNEAGAPSGYGSSTISVYSDIVDTGSLAWNSRWYLGRLTNSKVAHSAPTNTSPVVASFPAAGNSLDPAPPPPSPSPFPWLPAVLNLLLN
jgi:hypothetical protein